MKPAPKNISRSGRADRLLAIAREPNLSSWGWPAVENLGRLARMTQNRLTAVLGALCLVVMFGLIWAGDAGPAVYAIVGLGAAVMAAVCLITES